VGAGHDFKIVATFSSRNSYDLIARPNIKRPEDLRGKKIALNSIGGTGWMGVLFWLEHFGLDQTRDQISMQVLGDQPIMMQAVETGIADAAALDGVFSKILRHKASRSSANPPTSFNEPSARRWSCRKPFSASAPTSWKTISRRKSKRWPLPSLRRTKPR